MDVTMNSNTSLSSLYSKASPKEREQNFFHNTYNHRDSEIWKGDDDNILDAEK
jgi:hypothetical protein